MAELPAVSVLMVAKQHSPLEVYHISWTKISQIRRLKVADKY